MEKKLNIFQRKALVTKECGLLQKDSSIGGKYKALSEGAVLKAINIAEDTAGITTYTTRFEEIEHQLQTLQNGYSQHYVRIKAFMIAVNLDNPEERIEFEGIGEAVDAQDKAVGKAQTYATKYALLKFYKIPSGLDSDDYFSQETTVVDKTAKEKGFTLNAIRAEIARLNYGNVITNPEKLFAQGEARGWKYANGSDIDDLTAFIQKCYELATAQPTAQAPTQAPTQPSNQATTQASTQAYNLFIECDGFGLRHLFKTSKMLRDPLYGSYLRIKTLKGYKRIYIAGAGKIDGMARIRGRSFGSVVFAEIDLLNKEVVQEAFRRTMASQLRVHFADLNPPSPNHPIISEVFDVQNTIWTHWTMQDNPILTPQRIEEIRQVLSKNTYLYERDFLGLRVIPQGVIYSMFDMNENTAKELPKDCDLIDYYFSADGGVEHGTSCICWCVYKNRQTRKFLLYNVGEYFYSGQDTGIKKAMSDQALEISHFIAAMNHYFRRKPSEVLVDPACLVLIEELKKCKVYATKADNNAHDIKGNNKGIMVGIERTQILIADRTLKLFEAIPRWGHYQFLKEIGTYCIANNTGRPVEIYDDTMDALRYGVNHFWRRYCPNYA